MGRVDTVTNLLLAWTHGDAAALDRLTPLVASELRRIARRRMDREAADHTLQPTALINEAYVRLLDGQPVQWRNRTHFFAVAARLMRHILVDHARAKRNLKRGGGGRRVPLTDALALPSFENTSVLALDDALTTLAKLDARRCRVVELRCFAGLSVHETAEVLGVSPDTVMRDWKLALAWLRRECSRTGEP